MTTLRELSAAAVGHLVAIRDMMTADAGALMSHVEAIDPDHKYKTMALDFQLATRAWFQRISDAVIDLDPNAPPASLDPPPSPAPNAYAGVMLSQNELEALRTQRYAEMSQHRRQLVAAQYEARGIADLPMATINNKRMMHLDLTEEEQQQEIAFYTWSGFQTRVMEADGLHADAIAGADQEALAAYDVTTGWPT